MTATPDRSLPAPDLRSADRERTTSARPAGGSGRSDTHPAAPVLGTETGAAGQTRGPSAPPDPVVPPCAAEGPRPARVIGLDLSIAATGIADRTAGYPATRTIRTDVKDYGKDEPGTRRRLVYVASHIDGILYAGPRPALIAVEGPSYGSKGNALHQLAGLWWLVYDRLVRSELPIVIIPPGQVKKYATGNGNADKTAMAVALQRHAGIELGDDNQVDAWWLAAAALEHLGQPVVKLPAAQRAALDKITWPEVTR